jgi:predicted PurR-regulated permease PerM/methylmalonyl-CoA mutase cobalamin-binding subunit
MSEPTHVIVLKRLLGIVTLVVVVCVLYAAQEILLPFALAILLSFLLAPLVTRLERFWLGRIGSVVVVVGLAFCLIGGFGWVVGNQFVQVSADLPNYKDNLIRKIRFARWSASGALGRAKATIDEIGKELTEEPVESSQPPDAQARQWFSYIPFPGGNQADEDDAVDVRVVALPPSPLHQVSTWLGPLVAPLTTVGMTIVFVVFMLIKREDLRNRLLQLLGTEQFYVTTTALDDAAARLSRYLRMQLLINIGYGVVIASGLYLMGVPNAALWGALGGALRFLPYVGPWIGAALPITLSLAIFDNWTQPLSVVGLFVALELFVNNVAEPLLYGSSTGVSAAGIIVSAIFWTWLWGPVGLVLAMPLTVCMVVIGRHVPQLQFLDTLLSDNPPLSEHQGLYQRWLAQDEHEAAQLAKQFQSSHTASEFCDQLLIPALQLAERDRHADRLDDEQVRFAMESAEALVADLVLEPPASDESPSTSVPFSVLCIPAKDKADEVVGKMIAKLIERHGFQTATASTQRFLGELVEKLKDAPVDLIVISSLPPLAGRYSRLVCKRVHAAQPEIPILVGLWGGGRMVQTQSKLIDAGADQVVTSVGEAVEYLRRKRTALRLNRDSRPAGQAEMAVELSELI